MLTSYIRSQCRGADRQRSIRHYRQLAPGYDHQTTRIEQIREAAIAGLRLSAGEAVLDVACGTGQSLPQLIEQVGRQGRVLGVEQCPEMAATARGRIRPGSGHHSVLARPVEELQVP